MRIKRIMKRILDVLIYGSISALLAYGISIFMESKFSIKPYDMMTVIGLLVIAVGALSVVGGNSSALNISSIGDSNAQYAAQLNMEVTRMERDITDYFSNAKNHTQLYFTSSKLNIVWIGVIIVASGILMSLA